MIAAAALAAAAACGSAPAASQAPPQATGASRYAHFAAGRAQRQVQLATWLNARRGSGHGGVVAQQGVSDPQPSRGVPSPPVLPGGRDPARGVPHADEGEANGSSFGRNKAKFPGPYKAL